MLLHVFSASRFAPLAVELFETALPGRNEYIHIAWNRPVTNATPEMRTIPPTPAARRRIVRRLHRYQAIVLHGLKPAAARMMLDASPDTRFFWIGWGFEYHHWIPELAEQLYGPRTTHLLASLKWIPSRRMPLRFLESAGLLNSYRRRRGHLMAHAITQANVVSTPIREDYDLLRQLLPHLEAEFLQIVYGGVEGLFTIGPPVFGNDILIGNSGTPENNHAEIFHRLAELSLPGRRFVVPLTYGQPDYIHQITRLGQELLGSQFHPLHRHLPLKRYDEILSMCSVAIMNHRRQQAVGTINTMLYKGAKVLLHPNSTVYVHLERIGATVSALEEDHFSAADLENDLSPKAIAGNRECLQRTRTRAQSIADIRAWYGSLR